MSNLKETVISGEQVFDGNFLKIQRDKVILPNGKTAFREYIPIGIQDTGFMV